jgi:CRISPR-associated protein Cas2
MVKRYLVAYDIADPDRLRRVYAVVRGYAERVQYSVYEALLTAREKTLLDGQLRNEMNLCADQVLFLDLGDAEREHLDEISTLGLPYRPCRRTSIII